MITTDNVSCSSQVQICHLEDCTEDVTRKHQQGFGSLMLYHVISHFYGTSNKKNSSSYNLQTCQKKNIVNSYV